MNDHWDNVAEGMYVLNEKGMKALAGYMVSEEGQRCKRELEEAIDQAMKKLDEEWAALSFEEQFQRHQNQPRLFKKDGKIYCEAQDD